MRFKGFLTILCGFMDDLTEFHAFFYSARPDLSQDDPVEQRARESL